MPQIGEVKRGLEIGKKGGMNKFVWHACVKCGETRWTRTKHRKPIASICPKCNPNRRRQYLKVGHKLKVNKAGYVYIYIGRSDFFSPMANCRGYILEHRLNMAKYLGRCLHAWEIVHHIDGNKANNPSDNLCLETEAGHNQISQMQRVLIRQERKIQDLQARVTLLEAQLVVKNILEVK